MGWAPFDWSFLRELEEKLAQEEEKRKEAEKQAKAEDKIKALQAAGITVALNLATLGKTVTEVMG